MLVRHIGFLVFLDSVIEQDLTVDCKVLNNAPAQFQADVAVIALALVCHVKT